MWIYGDRERTADPVATLEGAARAWSSALATEPGIVRHGEIVGAFVELAGLLQGAADALFARCGRDAPHPLTDALTALVREAATAVDRSWRGEAPAPPAQATLETAAVELRRAAFGPAGIRIREAEGFAHYAFYPEAWAQAARALPPGTRHVIGLRSIGAALAPMAAAVLPTASVVTLRPTGPHFAREIRVAPEIDAYWTRDPNARFVVADEGPGLSGSSFCAVVEHLLALGIPHERIDVLPSHGQDLGREASAAHRALWPKLNRSVVSPSAFLFGDRPLAAWFEDVTGPVSRCEDLSGGAWRPLHFPEGPQPASNVAQERRKYRLTAERGRFLLKFAGLGAFGRTKADRAAALAEAGFCNPVLAFRHGFTLERWIEDAHPLPPEPPASSPETDPVPRLAAYLAFRADRFPVAEDAGADLDALIAMADYNIALGFGDGAAVDFRALVAGFDLASLRPRPVATDGKLDRHEWLRRPDGSLLKTDALDHCMAHDLVGAQDVAWDAAGAAVEFSLEEDAVERLLARIDAVAARPVDRTLFALMLPLYLAFRFGAARLAVDGCPASESESLTAQAARYAAPLIGLLQSRPQVSSRAAKRTRDPALLHDAPKPGSRVG